MSQTRPQENSLWVQRVPGLDGYGLWLVCQGAPAILLAPQVRKWQDVAERSMSLRAEVVSLSVVTPTILSGDGTRSPIPLGVIAEASAAALPLAFLSGRTADLIGITLEDDQRFCSIARFEQWIQNGTRKGLIHEWLAVAPAVWTEAGFNLAARPIPACDDDTVLVPVSQIDVEGSPRRHGMSVGIDAAWLGNPESGTQVLVVEMVRELVRRPEIERILLISETGAVPGGLGGVSKVSGLSWRAALESGALLVDIMHRPYQPAADVDYRRYYRVARCVAMTVLDFIGYDNPSYYESRSAWLAYRRAFDEKICQADRVFAISRNVGSRLERQFARRLSGPVRSVPLGTDHLLTLSDAEETDQPGPVLQALGGKRFLLVLGNDFEHKNRDFAVRVFCDMRSRGYEGQLVLAGFNLKHGSSYSHELSGAEDHANRIVRMAAVSGVEKRWLLRRADAVLYPTSSEGFGLVPFEAATLGTPTAFVGFGPFTESLPGVAACSGWRVREFSDHVFSLIATPSTQVEQIRAAGAGLTWKSYVDQILSEYQDMLSDGASWQVSRGSVLGSGVQVSPAVGSFARRAVNKLRRLAGRIF